MTRLSLTEIKQNIAQARKQAGLTQEDMSKALNVSQPAYSYYESGDKPIPLNKIKLISELLSIPLDSLLGEIEKNSSEENILEQINANLNRIAGTLEQMYILFENQHGKVKDS